MALTLLEELYHWPIEEGVAQDVRAAIPVNINNVAEFYYQAESLFDPKDGELPNVVPPWPVAFYEWSQTPTVREFGQTTVLQDRLHFGVLLVTQELDKEREVIEGKSGRWTVWVAGFARSRDRKVYRYKPFAIFISALGEVVLGPTGGVAMIVAPGDEDLEPEVRASLINMLKPALLANCFANCKNVEVIDQEPNPKLSAKQQKRYGVPKLTYKTLRIQPMQQVLATEGGMASGTSLVRALHICRGHFKDYRERGLFGRNHGLYWWDMHVRGDKRAGVVQKDYEVASSPVSE